LVLISSYCIRTDIHKSSPPGRDQLMTHYLLAPIRNIKEIRYIVDSAPSPSERSPSSPIPAPPSPIPSPSSLCDPPVDPPIPSAPLPRNPPPPPPAVSSALASQINLRRHQKLQNARCASPIPKQLCPRGVPGRPLPTCCPSYLPSHSNSLVLPQATVLEEVLRREPDRQNRGRRKKTLPKSPLDSKNIENCPAPRKPTQSHPSRKRAVHMVSL
jgi:hypothetical protein